MPPSRRQPRQTPPVRRPRVAGIRKPETVAGEPVDAVTPVEAPRPQPRPRPAATSTDAPEITDALAAEETAVFAPVKPSPRRKARDEGRQKPASFEEVDEAESEAEPPTPSATWKSETGRNKFLVPVALVVAGLLLAGAAVVFKINDNAISSATSNTALLDVAKTAQVKDQVSKAAEALFSYDFNNIAKTENAAKDLLITDDVRNKYNALMGEVKRLAPTQKMVLTSTVTRAAVVMLNGDLAKVMVFVDQSSVRTDTKATTAGSAQLYFNAQLVGGTWKIANMDTYVAQPAPGAPPASQAPVSSSPPPSK